MEEELKKTNEKVQMERLEIIITTCVMCITLLFVMFGITYLFNIGGLFIKLLVLAIGGAILASGVCELTEQVKKIKVFNSLLKVGKTLGKLFDGHTESNK